MLGDMCRGATIVYQPLGTMVYYCVGSGEYDELTSAPCVFCHAWVCSCTLSIAFVYCELLAEGATVL
jgi:hypothetical protein